MWIGGRGEILAGGYLGHLCRVGGRPLVADWPKSSDCWSVTSDHLPTDDRAPQFVKLRAGPFFQFFSNFLFLEVSGWA
jgi:hypothetical protein